MNMQVRYIIIGVETSSGQKQTLNTMSDVKVSISNKACESNCMLVRQKL